MNQANIDHKFRDFFEKNTSVMLLIDPKNGHILDANLSAANFYGYPQNNLIGMKISQINLLSPERIAEEMHQAVIENRNYFKFEHRLASGEIKNVEVHSTPMESEVGPLLFSIIQDVTDRTIAEEKVKSLLAEKEILLREVHHRVKNNMSVIHSLLDLQISSLKDKSAISALSDAASRVQSMAMLYDKLYQSQEYDNVSVSHYLSTLVDQIIANFPNNAKISAEKQFDEVFFESHRLQYIGIIINEIITNIMKYAFLPEKEGKIRTSGKLMGEHYHITIADDGEGMPDSISFDKPNGFGITLIQFLSKQLNTKTRIERKDGTIIHLQIPLKIV
jgi:PAS domain S-box-containing protein